MKPKLCILTTVSTSIKAFYQGQLKAFNEAGFETTVICANDQDLNDYLPETTIFHPVEFSRIIDPINDIKVLVSLYKYFKTNKFDIIQYSTPKASLLGSLASFAAGIPHRIYILWGLYYMGQSGAKKWLFKCFEKLICKFSHKIIPISHEMVEFAIKEGLGRRYKYEVMLNGSACGIDLDSFDPDKFRPDGRNIRDLLSIPQEAVVIGAVARLTGDKGMNELVHAFDKLSHKHPLLFLLLVGEQEEKDRLTTETISLIQANNRIIMAGWQNNTLPYYAAMDIFSLPTYREGFGEVNLEAQAMELPVVSTNVIGPRESIEDGTTGYLVEPRNADALIQPLDLLINNKALRQQMGKAGRQRVFHKFGRKQLIKEMVGYRVKLLQREI